MDKATTKLAQINKTNADNKLADQKHQDILNGSVKISDTVLSATVSLIKYLEGHVTKTEVINQLDSIGTPDVFEVKDAIEQLHATLKTHKNADLTGITELLQGVLIEVSKIPKELPEEKEERFIDYSDQFNGLKDLISSVNESIKAQELVVKAPDVNVASPTVNVETPDLKPLQTSLKDVEKAIKKIVIPKYQTDTKEVQKLIKASNILLKKLLDKPVSSGGGGGGGRATPYQDGNSIPAFVTLTPQGKVPIDIDMVAEGIATSANQIQERDIMDAVYEALSRLEFLQTAKNVDGSLRVTAISGTISTVSTVTNLTNFNGYDARVIIPSNSNTTAILSNINNISVN